MGSLRSWDASAANADDGAQLPQLISPQNTTSGLGAKTAYRSKKNEAFLRRAMFKSNSHHNKPPRRPMPEHIAHANAKRSAVRSAVAHVFARQKHRACSSAPSASLRARITIGMASLADNIQRLAWLEERGGLHSAKERAAEPRSCPENRRNQARTAAPQGQKPAIRPFAPPSVQK
jgi:hypothetical protein